jgi:phasin family protein
MVKSSQENVVEAAQNQLAAQQERWVTFANKALESATKLAELNWALAKEIFDENTASAQQLLTAKSPQELLSLDSGGVRSNFSRLLTYAGALTSITTDMQAELLKAAQIQTGETFLNAANVVGASTGKATDPAPNPFELMKVAMENAKGGFEQWVATSKKAAEAMQDNMKMTATGAESPAKRNSNPRK